ncbi:MAG TPA: AMIN domain-containing protein [Blastocatellia bacterium]|jgi:type IV pilus assembly protein PilQ
MIKFNRRTIAALALVALVSNALVFAKPAISIFTPEGRAFTLVSLRTENVEGRTRILIESNAPPLYTVFRPTERLIQIEMPSADSKLAPEYEVKSSLVESVTVRDAKQSGRAATRIDIAVRGAASDRTRVEGNTLVVEISPDASAKAAPAKADGRDSLASQAKQASQPVDNSAGVEVTPPPAKPAAANEGAKPKPTALRPATLVRAVRHESAGNAVRVIVDTDGAAQFKDFVLADPWRVVVDITGVRLTTGNQTINVGAASVDRFRVGQPAAGTVRIVLDTKSKVPYTVERDGTQLIITIGPASAFVRSEPDGIVKQSEAQPEVRVAGQRVVNNDSKNQPAGKSNLPANTNVQGNKPASGKTVQELTASQPSGPQTGTQVAQRPQPSAPQRVRETLSQPVTQPVANRPANDTARPTQTTPPSVAAANNQQKKNDVSLCDPNYVGGPLSFDLRAGVDIRDMLRFVSEQYGINFIVDKSVPTSVPVDVRITELPWNQILQSVLRAHRLGWVCEGNGRLVRIATLEAIKEEEKQQLDIVKAKMESLPLETKIIHLRYARAAGSLQGTGAGRSGGGRQSGVSSGTGPQAGATLVAIAEKRLSTRGRIEADVRTNSLIVTDLPDYIRAVENIISQLDRPEPQVEIEARIVVANRDFLRDIGNELAAAAINTSNGAIGFLQTAATQITGGGSVSTPTGQGGGSGSGDSGQGNGQGGGGSSNKGQIGPNLVGPFASNALRVGTASGVLSLTTGLLGTGIISTALSASERKGQIRIVASPRVAAQNNTTAEIINGVQIPVQTVSNNTITTTFITAALRLEITPIIVEETGEVTMHVVAENNTVNASLASQLNGGTPGINTQSAESTVRIQDGGTFVMGGVNIDTESHSQNRMPGIARIPIIGELFKRRTTQRTMDEILFFITPRIVRPEGNFGPRTQRSATEGTPSPTQRAAAPVQGPQPANQASQPANQPPAQKQQTGGKGGQ